MICWQSLSFLAFRCITPIPAFIFTCHSLSLSSHGHLLIRRPVILDLGSTLLQYDLILIDYICNNPISYYSHILRHWRFGLQHILGGEGGKSHSVHCKGYTRTLLTLLHLSSCFCLHFILLYPSPGDNRDNHYPELHVCHHSLALYCFIT